MFNFLSSSYFSGSYFWVSRQYLQIDFKFFPRFEEFSVLKVLCRPLDVFALGVLDRLDLLQVPLQAVFPEDFHILVSLVYGGLVPFHG